MTRLREAIHTARRRLAFLESKIDGHRYSDHALTWAKAEAASLRVLIELAEEHVGKPPYQRAG